MKRITERNTMRARRLRLREWLCGFFVCLASAFGALHADGLRITQLDPAQLLPLQRITAYVVATDSQGRPLRDLRQEQFELFEYSGENDESDQTSVPILNFAASEAERGPVSFFVLLDNSGSMYVRTGGRTRIDHARDATRSFLRELDPRYDQVALASYHTSTTMHTDFTADPQDLEAGMLEIVRPKGAEAYTELYASLNDALEQIRVRKGRRVLIVLSDGENRPYFTYTGKPHPALGTRVVPYTEPLQTGQAEGVSVFVINYGSGYLRRDRRLAQIARETGGVVFDARNARELAGVYARIIEQVRGEYQITYRATMIPADRRFVRLQFSGGQNRPQETTRYYFASGLFGMPMKALTPWLLLPLALALLAAALLYKKKFERDPGEPTLEVIDPGARRRVKQVVPLNGAHTIIGGNAGADITIAHSKFNKDLNRTSSGDSRASRATVLYDSKRRAYTLVGEGGVRVNNKRLRNNRSLASGDVIDIDGTTIVFDDGSV